MFFDQYIPNYYLMKPIYIYNDYIVFMELFPLLYADDTIILLQDLHSPQQLAVVIKVNSSKSEIVIFSRGKV